MEEKSYEGGKEVVIVPKDQDLTFRSQSVKKDLAKYWEREFINGCLDKISNGKHHMLFFLLWRSGIRISEAISLTKGDIDIENYTMTVKWLKSRKYHNRIVPLHPDLRNVLHTYTSTMKSSDMLFGFTRQRAWQLSKKYFGGNPHQMRHSFAVNWLRCKGELVMLHRILGHSKIQTTMEYLKIVPYDQGKELLKVNFN